MEETIKFRHFYGRFCFETALIILENLEFSSLRFHVDISFYTECRSGKLWNGSDIEVKN